MNKINLHQVSINSLIKNNVHKNKINNTLTNNLSNDFESFLNDAQRSNSVKFSKHAKERIDSRNISFNNEDMNKIEDAINKAEKKGVKEVLIIKKDIALIASTKNKTIITTITSENLKENLFTNIDGAVII
ncbi:flagellar operon protein [Gottschalkia purinilytica]|uniref:Flagellar operon protein n=1 Tax=Gottschalkia purinilytica TaxID=1503 RepID=A0A0L0WBE5_GOTPU|nr:TIGR02530 family flagellar biosynthesis protein [Gottschalkia purinilytica]KNF08818.1 flagellar operon protein [Gottschalkia purinilytica]